MSTASFSLLVSVFPLISTVLQHFSCNLPRTNQLPSKWIGHFSVSSASAKRCRPFSIFIAIYTIPEQWRTRRNRFWNMKGRMKRKEGKVNKLTSKSQERQKSDKKSTKNCIAVLLLPPLQLTNGWSLMLGLFWFYSFSCDFLCYNRCVWRPTSLILTLALSSNEPLSLEAQTFPIIFSASHSSTPLSLSLHPIVSTPLSLSYYLCSYTWIGNSLA